MSWQREMAKCCPTCGTREEEWESDPFAYVTEARRCVGCELIEMERENIPKDANTKGMKIVLVKRPPRRKKGRRP